jgi:predicted nucleic acid-binding protein
MAQFDDDCGQGLWTWLPLTSALVQRAAVAFTHLPRPVFLRAADALHLTCAQEHGLRAIYTNDRHMSSAARHFRLKARTVVAA